ncbi:MAG: hypothetical protein AAGF59_08505 [Pseudomonadota bacterium]
MTNFENFEFTGGDQADNITTGDGDDVLFGFGGNDIFNAAKAEQNIVAVTGGDVVRLIAAVEFKVFEIRHRIDNAIDGHVRCTGVHGVVDAIREIENECIRIVAAVDHVAKIEIGNGHPVIARAAVDGIAAGSAGNRIVARVAVDDVIQRPACDRIVTVTGIERRSDHKSRLGGFRRVGGERYRVIASERIVLRAVRIGPCRDIIEVDNIVVLGEETRRRAVEDEVVFIQIGDRDIFQNEDVAAGELDFGMRTEITGKQKQTGEIVDAQIADPDLIRAAGAGAKIQDDIRSEAEGNLESIVAPTADQNVIAGAADQSIVALAADEKIVTVPTDQGIVTFPAEQDIVSGPAVDGVVAAPAENQISVIGSVQIVVVFRANDNGHANPHFFVGQQTRNTEHGASKSRLAIRCPYILFH